MRTGRPPNGHAGLTTPSRRANVMWKTARERGGRGELRVGYRERGIMPSIWRKKTEKGRGNAVWRAGSAPGTRGSSSTEPAAEAGGDARVMVKCVGLGRWPPRGGVRQVQTLSEEGSVALVPRRVRNRSRPFLGWGRLRAEGFGGCMAHIFAEVITVQQDGPQRRGLQVVFQAHCNDGAGKASGGSRRSLQRCGWGGDAG